MNTQARGDGTGRAATEQQPATAGQSRLNVAIVGHVDHGKSTLVGRLLHDMGALPEGKLEAVEEMCRRRGMPFEWAFVTDALKAERDQGVTIDVSHIRFRTEGREYVLIDAPGHREFLKNMISGASSSDAALLVIDAAEGVQEQSRRHGYLLHLLGVRQVVVVVNKMDRVDYAADRFAAIERDFRAYLNSVGVVPIFVLPASARGGDNIVERGDRMPWNTGPTVIEALERLQPAVPPRDLPLRLPVQDVYKFDERRIIAGRIESGRLQVGDEVLFSPSNKSAVVKTLETWSRDEPLSSAYAGQSVGLTLDEQIFVERGELISLLDNPPIETNVMPARIFWLGMEPLAEGKRYTLKLHTSITPVEVQKVVRVIDMEDLSSAEATEVARDSVAEIVLRSQSMLALDTYAENPRTGRFVLVDGHEVVGGGVISMEGYPDQRPSVTVKSTNVQEVKHGVSNTMRARRNGHAGGVLWFTGLSGAGKSSLAIEIEKRLFKKGYHVYVLDGDNVRRGLNANLGFDPEDRAENIRRVGEVAGLFADAGMIVISAFISPYRADRDRARAAAGKRFHEVHIKADLETCEARDPKGLYKKARRGEIPDFTGVSAPYEPPETPDLVVDTAAETLAQSVDRILDYVARNFELTGS